MGSPPLPIVVVATVRADRYEPLQTAPQLAGLEARLFEDLKPMPRDRYREVICGPAARAQRAGSRLQWAPELVERLLADCAAGADALPLLSLTLARLYEDYGGGVVGAGRVRRRWAGCAGWCRPRSTRCSPPTPTPAAVS